MAKQQLTDPININASLFTCNTDSKGKAKISWRNQSPGASMSQHEGFSPVQAKRSSRLLYLATLSLLERGYRLLWNSTSGLKLGLLGIHTMMTENLESTSFLLIWHTGYDKKQDTWEDKRNSHLARIACHFEDRHPLASKALSAPYEAWDSLSLNSFCFKNSASL